MGKKHELVKETRIRKESGYNYYLSKEGDVYRIRVRKHKKKDLRRQERVESRI